MLGGGGAALGGNYFGLSGVYSRGGIQFNGGGEVCSTINWLSLLKDPQAELLPPASVRESVQAPALAAMYCSILGY